MNIPVEDSLNILGSSPTEVANTLLQMRCAGLPNDTICNPIIIYLWRMKGLRPGSRINSEFSELVLANPTRTRKHNNRIKLPDPVRDFLHQFNNGKWGILESDILSRIPKNHREIIIRNFDVLFPRKR